MTTNQTIDGVLVSRELLDKVCNGYAQEQGHALNELRALLDEPAPAVDGEQWYADTPDGDSALVTRVAALCNHPSMSFHQVALLEGAISESRTGSTPAAQPQADGPLTNEGSTPTPLPQGEPVANPVLAYADSYRAMQRQGAETVSIWSVITDLERNIAPLYAEQPAPVAVVLPERLNHTDGLYPYEYVTGHNAAIDKMLGVKS